MILSWASDSCEEPMRLAGTCSMYSNSAMPQLRTAAMYHGRSDRLRRWAYHANVMNTLEAVRSTTVRSTTEFKAKRPPNGFYRRRPTGAPAHQVPCRFDLTLDVCPLP